MSIEDATAYVQHIVTVKPAQFIIHGYSTCDDVEEVIEQLGQQRIVAVPQITFRHRGSSSPDYPKVEVRVVLKLTYPLKLAHI